MNKSDNFLHSKACANIKILIFVLMLIVGANSNQKYWPFIPYDMYCIEKASYLKRFWFKIISDNPPTVIRAEKLARISDRFYLKINLLRMKTLKVEDPARNAFIMEELRKKVEKKYHRSVKLQLYEETIHYENEKRIGRDILLVGESQ